MLEDGVLPVGHVFIGIVGTAPVSNVSDDRAGFDGTLVLVPSSFLGRKSAFAEMDVSIVLFAILSYYSPDSGMPQRRSCPAYGDDKAASVGLKLPVDLTDVSDFAKRRSVG